jgi:hypothetical protein
VFDNDCARLHSRIPSSPLAADRPGGLRARRPDLPAKKQRTMFPLKTFENNLTASSVRPEGGEK